jgi:hypothetical protein
MTLDEILKRLDLKLGMKIIDTKPSEYRRCKDPIHTLVKNSHNGFVFEGSDGGYFPPIYVLLHLGTRFKVIENEQDN